MQHVNLYRSYWKRKKIITVISLLLMITLLMGGFLFTDLVEGDSGQPGKSVPQRLESLLGVTKEYGVFANELTLQNDFQSNFATKLLWLTSHSLGCDMTNKPGTIYFQNIKSYSGNRLQLKHNAASNIVIGVPFTNVVSEYKVTFDGTDLYMDYSNCRNVNLIFDEEHKFLNIDAAIEYVRDTFGIIKTQSDTQGISCNYMDVNNSYIDVSNVQDKTCYVNINIEDFIRINEGGLKIKKNNDQLVIININGCDSNTELRICRYYVENTGAVLDINSPYDPITDTIIWNCVNIEKVELKDVKGIVIAPDADVSLASTCEGRIICKTFVNPGGEMHFIARDISEEPETDTEMTTPAESSSVPEELSSVSEESSSVSEESSSVPEESSSVPEESSSVPEESSSVPEESSSVPEESSSVPEESSSVLEESSSVPEESSSVPEESSSVPEESSSVPEESSSVPEESSSVPEESSSVPEESSSVPEESSSVPEESSSVLEESSSVPEESSSVPEESSSVPEESSSVPEESSSVPEESLAPETSSEQEKSSDLEESKETEPSSPYNVKTNDDGKSDSYILFMLLSGVLIVSIIMEILYKRKNVCNDID